MTTEQMDWLDDERRRREDDERAAAQLRRAATGQRATAAEPDRDATQDKSIELFMQRVREAPRWAGSEPIEYDTMHPDCDCSVCCPPCAVPECGSFDVTARMVPTDGTLRHRARVLLCDEHGGRQPTETEWERR